MVRCWRCAARDAAQPGTRNISREFCGFLKCEAAGEKQRHNSMSMRLLVPNMQM
jgi:hypothetical protein